jgi:hypothetical protein
MSHCHAIRRAAYGIAQAALLAEHWNIGTSDQSWLSTGLTLDRVVAVRHIPEVLEAHGNAALQLQAVAWS